MMKPNSGIYVIDNKKAKKVYIGQAQNIRVRWQNHKSAFRRGDHPNKHLQASWNKYGEKAFKFLVLEYCQIEQLDEREQHYLNIIPESIRYNQSIDAKYPLRGRKHSEETRKKISESHKGRRFTEEHKRKLSEAAKNRDPETRIITDETRQKMIAGRKGLGNFRLGKTNSPESKRKVSEANKGNTYCKGRVMSEETRRKISEAKKGENGPHFGKKHSLETRKKMSESHKKRLALMKAEKEA